MEDKKLQELRDWCKKFVSREKYKDPDSITVGFNYKDQGFYIKYAEILNSRTYFIDTEKEKFRVRFDETCEEPGLIFEKIIGKKVVSKYYLKSDQFGFSRPDEDMKYPYDVYLKKVLENDVKNGENYLPKAKENVEKWIKITRQVGGSFFWPMEKLSDGKFELNPTYNLERGGTKFKRKGSYIEDRVDLTLLEVCEIYNSGILDIYKKLKGNVLIKNCSTVTMRWLSEFESFEKFVDFFALTPFVKKENDKKYVPYNLLSENLEVFDVKNISRSRELFEPTMTIKDYEILFNRIVEKIKERRKELGLEEDTM